MLLRDRSTLDEQLVCVLDVADCRHDRSGQLAAKLTAERVGVDLLLDLPAQPAADGTRLVLFVNTHVFTDAGNLRFDLRKEAVDRGYGGDRAVDVVIGQIWGFQIGRLAKLIFVGPVILLTGRETVLLEQTGNLEALPERREMFYFLHAERTDSLGTENEVGNLHQMADEGEQSLAGKRNGLVAQDRGGNVGVVALRTGNAGNITVRAVDGRGIDEVHRLGRVLHQVVDMAERTIFRLGEIVLQISLLLELLPRRIQQVGAVRAGIAETALAEREIRQADKRLDDGKQTLRLEGKRSVAQNFVVDCGVAGCGHCFPSFLMVDFCRRNKKSSDALTPDD